MIAPKSDSRRRGPRGRVSLVPRSEEQETRRDEEEVRRVFARWLEGMACRDGKTLASLLAEEGPIVSIGTGRTEVSTTRDELVQAYGRDFAQAAEVWIDPPEHFEVQVGGRLAVVFFHARCFFETGGARIPLQSRRTVVFRKCGGTWRLIHSHHSVPDWEQPDESSYPRHLGRRYRLLSQHLRDIILFVRERDDRILETNRAAELAYGYGPEEFSALPLESLFSEEAWRVFQGWRRGEDPGESLFEMEHRRRDGKPLPLEVSIQRVVESGEPLLLLVSRDIAERKQLLEELRHAATHDGLTGILNRLHFERMLRHQMELATRYGMPLSLVMMDVDHFKCVNDSFGHATGDSVLRELCAIIEGRIRTSDLFCRWGGEEFMLLLPVASASARQLAESLRQSVERHDFPGAGQITLSFGVAGGEDGLSLESFCDRADAALYAAKGEGRNRVRVWDEALNLRFSARSFCAGKDVPE